MGDERSMREWLSGAPPWLAGDERLEAQVARLDRHFMAPSTVLDLAGWVMEHLGHAGSPHRVP